MLPTFRSRVQVPSPAEEYKNEKIYFILSLIMLLNSCMQTSYTLDRDMKNLLETIKCDLSFSW